MTNLNPIHECNAREVEMMVGKAMCAWANHESAMKAEQQLRREYGDKVFDATTAAQMSEYEAMVRCIAMFVSDTLPAICEHVIGRAEAEFGIK